MRKFFSLIAAVLFAGSMMADSYTIAFKDAGAGQGDSNTSLTSTTVADYVAEGADLVSAVAVSGKVYNGQDGYGLKFGNSSNPGSITLTLAAAVTPTSIVMNASPWSATEGAGLLQDSVYETKSTGAKGTFADFTYEYDGATEVTTIIVGTSTKRGYVKSITINLEGGEIIPPVEEGCNWDEIEFLGNGSGNEAYTNRFKVCAGDSAPTSIVNIQAPAWADEPGIYVTFPSAAFGAISLDEAQYVIDGAGMVLYVSAFLYDAETEVTVVCQDVTYTLTIKNANPETPVIEPINCAAVYNMAKNDVVDLLNPVTVTYSNGANVWVMDGSASMLIYLPSGFTNNFQAGDVLSGIAGVVDIYQNIVYEVKPDATQAAAIVATPGEAPAPSQHAVIEATDVNQYVILPGFSIEGTFTTASKTSLPAVLGEDTVTIYNNFKFAYTFEAGKTYDIIGVVSAYKGNPQVYFISAEEVGGEVPPTPTFDYYVVGSMTSWAANANYKLVANPENEGEYMGEFTFAANDQFKVAYSNGSTIEDSNWFPGGMDNNYVITEAGDYNVYFRPEGGVEGWYEGFFNVIKKETPIVEAITCSAVYEMAKNDVVDLLNDVVVTYANGKNVWVKDETASMLIYLSANTTWNAGDVLSGVAGVVDVYNGVHEVKPSADQVAAIVATAGEAPAAEAVAAVAATDVNKYIVMENVAAEGVFAEGTASNLTINGVTVRNNFKNGYTFEAGKTYNIYGVVTIYSNNPQVYFITAEEAGEVEPTIKYYVCGNMTNWQVNEDYKLVANPANEGEYMGEFTFADMAEFKVVSSTDGSAIIDWFPAGTGNNYNISEQGGDYNVYFRPEGGVEGWYEGFFNVVKKEAPAAISCLDVYQMAKNDVVDLLNDVVVTYANGKNVWVKDETASMLIYLSANTTWNAGDVLSGVAGVVDVYNGIHEIKPSADQVAAVVATPGEAPAPEVVATVTADDVNKYIVMKGVAAEGAFEEGTQSNLTINGITVRNQFKNGYTFEAGKVYNIYGVVTLYQNNPQVYFITAESAEGIDNTNVELKATKAIENGQLIIIKNGVRYDARGNRL